jgi:hypothetical protein
MLWVWLDTYTVKSENLSLTPMPPHPLPLPGGERGRVRGNFKCVWLGFRVWCLEFEEFRIYMMVFP